MNIQEGSAGVWDGSTNWTMKVLTAGGTKTLYFMVYAFPSGGGNSLQNWWSGSLTINPGERTKTVDLGDMAMTPANYSYVTVTDSAALQKELDNANSYFYSPYTDLSHANEYAYITFQISMNSNGWTFMWFLDGAPAIPETSDSVSEYSTNKYFSAKNYNPGTHYATLMAIKNGLIATREFSFTVTE
jgi:hypothetical protein